eukprot:398798-Pyramimonas_sp.AAC.1
MILASRSPLRKALGALSRHPEGFLGRFGAFLRDMDRNAWAFSWGPFWPVLGTLLAPKMLWGSIR